MSAISPSTQKEGPVPIAHWPLRGDCRDHSGHGHHGDNRGVDFAATGPDGEPNSAARFDGRRAFIEVADHPSLRLGTHTFSIAAWVHTENVIDDVLGDIASKYDAQIRRGFNFSIQNFSGVTSTQSNYRHLHFGIDQDHIEPQWTDCGRPGNNVYVCALAVCQGSLYAGTYEAGADEAGRVYRYAGGEEWIDCGAPDLCNAVLSLAVFRGQLYAGVGHYRAQGSSLEASPNTRSGGKVYRYDGGEWVDCGKLRAEEPTEGALYGEWVQNLQDWSMDDIDTVSSLAVYRDALYAMPSYHRGLYRYDGASWTDCGDPGCRLMSLGVYDGDLYAAGNEGHKRGGIYRYDGGRQWSHAGDQQGVDQVYSFAVYEGDLYAGTWPEARVFRLDGESTWTDCGRLCEELETMAMMVYNGQLYAGTLPLAEVYRYDGGTRWRSTGQLDTTPDVRYRRAWSMAVYRGKLFCGTLPSGRVYSLEAGKSATFDEELQPGWRHLAAVREHDHLKLYVDGHVVARSTSFDPAAYDLGNDRPWRIGAGAHDYFNGCIGDLRLYDRALTEAEIATLYHPST